MASVGRMVPGCPGPLRGAWSFILDAGRLVVECRLVGPWPNTHLKFMITAGSQTFKGSKHVDRKFRTGCMPCV